MGKLNNLSKNLLPKGATTERIKEDSEGQRIDNFLLKYLSRVPKSHIYQLLRSGQVRVNSKRISTKHKLQLNDLVRIPPVRTVESNTSSFKYIIKSNFILLNTLFEDDALLVINKPSGMAVHGGSGISFGVIEQLRAQHPDWKFLELVHRLDRDTSGVLLLAKKRNALVELHRQIRDGSVDKRYLVLVKGKWRNSKQSVKFSLNKYVTASGERRVAVVTNVDKNQKSVTAHTVFTLQDSWEKFSLLEAELKTGRTHQIRVHLAHLGFPIVGDDKYGDFLLNKMLARKDQELSLTRMFLHSYKTTITHPLSGKRIQIEAPLAKDLQLFQKKLDIQGKLKPE
ncbi:MAG: RluA family pseudouridine synthase [Nitrosomonas sp.]|nr:RluA family pseudouridine synthase [Nitrosomonas sp.]MDP1951567.1 RluA family pseudouridine synthase [Nitrosomonas sp.]